MPKRVLESTVRAKVRALFKAHGATFYANVAGPMGRAGVSDFTACHFGRFIAVECKAGPGDKPTQLQEHYLNQVRRCGGIALVVHNENLSALDEQLQEIGNEFENGIGKGARIHE